MPRRAALDVDRLRLLREVGLRGSIAGAARAVGLTASAVSQQLALLERETATTLLERTSRGVTLTGAGHALAVRAAEVADVLDAARADLDRLTGALSGPVAVASVASAAATVVSPALVRLRDAHPDITVSVVSAEPERGLGLLLGGDVDVAVVDEYDYVPLALPEAVAVTELVREPLVLVRPVGDTPRRPASLAVFAGRDWVMPPESAACGRAVRAACRTAGFEPRVRWQTDDMLLLVRAVADGHGVAVLPRRSVAAEAAAVEIRAVPGLPRPPGSSTRGETGRVALRRRLLAVARTGVAPRPAVRAVLTSLAEAAR